MLCEAVELMLLLSWKKTVKALAMRLNLDGQLMKVVQFALLQFIETNEAHSGIILITQQQYSIGDYLRGLMKIISSRDAEDMVNQVQFLGDYLRNL
jgi:hypothetical protein